MQIDIDRSGVLTVFGSHSADKVEIGWEAGNYLIDVDTAALVSGLCGTTQNPGRITCQANYNNLNGMLVYGNAGADEITVERSVPAFVTTTINGGSGSNVLTGGDTKDVITTDDGADGTVIRGGGNLDQIWVPAGGTAFGEGASDVFHSQTPCEGGRVGGGGGNDNLVFTGSPRGVKADLGKGYARHVTGNCNQQMKIDGDVESLEGTRYNDVLILGKKLRTRDRSAACSAARGSTH